jgi:hypothetical protein
MSDAKRIAYDMAQKVGERVERLEACSGWSEIFIPMIQKIRDEAQGQINEIGTDQREADFYRGELSLCDDILKFCERRKKSSAANMAANINPID